MLFILSIIIAIVLAIAATRLAIPAYRLAAVAGVVVFAVVALLQMMTVVPAGHVGVVDVFGNVSNTTLKPGVNLVNPLAEVKHFSVKTQESFQEAEVPSREGLTVGLEVSALFHLDPDMADDIYREVGPNYVEVLLIPLFRSVTRGVTAEYDAKALYTSQREELAKKIQTALMAEVGKRGIVIENTPLRQVSLPPNLRTAIEQKLQAEQESEKMEFVLTREKQEAERKRVEAQGIADYQTIISEGLNENVLRWKGIEATEKLSRSENSKVVVIGSGNGGLPIILGDQ